MYSLGQFDKAWLRNLYRSMLRIRLVEEEIAARYSEQEMRCPVHLSVGQEAVAVGSCVPLTQDDQIVSTHRCHGHYLAKGGDLRAMLAEIYGREDGCCGGRGGSMHLMDHRVGVLASVPIVGSSIPLGVGAALAFRQQDRSCVAVVFTGEGGLEEGVWHESANFASLMRLPVVFVVENNLYAVYTPLYQRQPDRPLVNVATPYDMPVHQVDGNDVLAVFQVAQQAVERARSGAGPTLIIADTYRWREHCGPNYDNTLGYRTTEEFENWKSHCPIATFSRYLRKNGILDDLLERSLTDEIKAEIEAAFSFAKSAPFPDPSTAAHHVYA